ncbi:P-loop NTPase fold protein [Streptomyces antibioticus]|uniref:KAP family P-loop NTPase fold protein n=1 Tax=Streptomyces antibioticus TaxID=1890 RepID=UPI002255A521|nr:P-loop NTPase fold protein [Streptomyces antibioticus]MCX4742441.1 KAP family NTPase [Streptomyces antibioticus]
MRLLTDNPVTEPADDAFHFGPYVSMLHAAVERAEPLPLTVGVFGSWGTGKSSLLRLWEHRLKEKKVPTIWFNPWKYDRKVEVWAALLHTILAEMETKQGLREKALRLAKAATWLSVRAGLGTAASLATGGVVKSGDVDTMLTELAEGDAEQYRQINRFENDFRDAVEEFVGTDGRLVVFVDDLDRCTPESAMTVLESLKLFLGESRCVFVLALDLDVLAAVATNKFGDAFKDAPAEVVSGLAYLDKIVQLPFFLPDVSFETLRSAFASYVVQREDDDDFWELLRRGLGANPRRLKRFVNVFNMALGIAAAQAGSAQDRAFRLQLAALLVIRSRHRDFFHLLAADPTSWETLVTFFRRRQDTPEKREQHRLALPTELDRFADDRTLEALLAWRGGPVGVPSVETVRSMITTVRTTTGPDRLSAADL